VELVGENRGEVAIGRRMGERKRRRYGGGIGKWRR